jgi:hypothetical protein
LLDEIAREARARAGDAAPAPPGPAPPTAEWDRAVEELRRQLDRATARFGRTYTSAQVRDAVRAVELRPREYEQPAVQGALDFAERVVTGLAIRFAAIENYLERGGAVPDAKYAPVAEWLLLEDRITVALQRGRDL